MISSSDVARRRQLLVIGAGAAGTAAGPALAAALSSEQPLQVRIMDRGTLTAEHLAHREMYPSGVPGETKAAALARRIRDAGPGLEVEVLHGNLTRWPMPYFRAGLAFVALDSEPQRLAAQRRLRAAGTPALFAGVAENAWLLGAGAAFPEPCYACCGQESVPLEPTSCVPLPSGPSTRALASVQALRLLPALAASLARDVLLGRGAGTIVSATAGRPPARARLERDPDCPGPHAPPPPVAAGLRAGPGLALGEAFSIAASVLGLPEISLVAGTAAYRADHACGACGATHLTGGDLVRAWPARERCPRCGSEDVVPGLRVQRIDAAGARRHGWLDLSLAALGVPPGGEVVVTSTGSPAVIFFRDPERGAPS